MHFEYYCWNNLVPILKYPFSFHFSDHLMDMYCNTKLISHEI